LVDIAQGVGDRLDPGAVLRDGEGVHFWHMSWRLLMR
jgi:hypothetical protein